MGARPAAAAPALRSRPRLADHRLAYLDYEGPISGERGSVTRWDEGQYAVEQQTATQWVLLLAGEKLQGTVTLYCLADDLEKWFFRFVEQTGHETRSRPETVSMGPAQRGPTMCTLRLVGCGRSTHVDFPSPSRSVSMRTGSIVGGGGTRAWPRDRRRHAATRDANAMSRAASDNAVEHLAQRHRQQARPGY